MAPVYARWVDRRERGVGRRGGLHFVPQSGPAVLCVAGDGFPPVGSCAINSAGWREQEARCPGRPVQPRCRRCSPGAAAAATCPQLPLHGWAPARHSSFATCRLQAVKMGAQMPGSAAPCLHAAHGARRPKHRCRRPRRVGGWGSTHHPPQGCVQPAQIAPLNSRPADSRPAGSRPGLAAAAHTVLHRVLHTAPAARRRWEACPAAGRAAARRRSWAHHSWARQGRRGEAAAGSTAPAAARTGRAAAACSQVGAAHAVGIRRLSKGLARPAQLGGAGRPASSPEPLQTRPAATPGSRAHTGTTTPAAMHKLTCSRQQEGAARRSRLPEEGMAAARRRSRRSLAAAAQQEGRGSSVGELVRCSRMGKPRWHAVRQHAFARQRSLTALPQRRRRRRAGRAAQRCVRHTAPARARAAAQSPRLRAEDWGSEAGLAGEGSGWTWWQLPPGEEGGT